MAYVYMLSTHDEYGAENPTATLDRSRLPAMLDEHWPHEHWQRWREWLDEARGPLAKLLEQPDEALAARGGGSNLHDGWGGIQLHVIKLA